MKKNYQILLKVLIVALLVGYTSVIYAQNANREEGSDKLYYQWYINLNGGITQTNCDIQKTSPAGN